MITVVVGLQWGDEGKGKIVDLLTPEYSYVVRFQGGNNAGHTIKTENETYKLHIVPSGILNPNIRSVIGNGTVINPQVLCSEIESLKSKGVKITPENLSISSNAHIILPEYIQEDCENESNSKSRIGTTKKGIGPTYAAKIARKGIRLSDYINEINSRHSKLKNLLSPFVTDTVDLIHNAIRFNEPILLEGAQGTFLDVDHGTYPYVTSSNTIAGAACTGAGIGPTYINNVIGVVKAYTTRVGEGPFATELLFDEGDYLRDLGSEYGTTTGRPRRCGWLDLPMVKKACMLNGVTEICLTKLDVLSAYSTIPVCISHENGTPVYHILKGWKQDISFCESWEELPGECKNYVEYIEEFVGVKVTYIGTGPKRKQTIIRG